MIQDYRIEILASQCDEYNRNGRESYGEDAEQLSFREYIEREADNDPAFFHFLFDTEEVTDKMLQEYQDWLDTL